MELKVSKAIPEKREVKVQQDLLAHLVQLVTLALEEKGVGKEHLDHQD